MPWGNDDAACPKVGCTLILFPLKPQVKITRVCGELAVSRSIGDPDFKGIATVEGGDPPPDLFFNFPADHTRTFSADLVIADPEILAFDILPCKGVGGPTAGPGANALFPVAPPCPHFWRACSRALPSALCRRSHRTAHCLMSDV